MHILWYEGQQRWQSGCCHWELNPNSSPNRAVTFWEPPAFTYNSYIIQFCIMLVCCASLLLLIISKTLLLEANLMNTLVTRQTVKKETICSGLGKRLQPCMYNIIHSNTKIIKKISLFKIDKRIRTVVERYKKTHEQMQCQYRWAGRMSYVGLSLYSSIKLCERSIDLSWFSQYLVVTTETLF